MYCRWRLDSAAVVVNALSMPWKELRSYMLSQFALIPRCLSTLREEQTSRRTSINNHASPSLAQPIVVSPPFQESLQCAVTIATFSRHCHESRRPDPSIDASGASASGHLACVRQSCRTKGLSEGFITIIMRSCRNARESAYSFAWRQWDSWCLERETDMLSAPLGLSCIFKMGSLRREAVSSTISTRPVQPFQ